MDLLLWRHGDEAQHDDHLKRPLTLRGEKQARAVAKWIRQHAPKHLRIIVSPAQGARQSAATLGLAFEISPNLGPKSQASDLLAVAGWPDGTGKRHGAVLLIGHQPGLGQLASLLLAGNERPWTIKKGGLWWFSNRVRAGETQTVLRSVVYPDDLKGD